MRSPADSTHQADMLKPAHAIASSITPKRARPESAMARLISAKPDAAAASATRISGAHSVGASSAVAREAQQSARERPASAKGRVESSARKVFGGVRAHTPLDQRSRPATPERRAVVDATALKARAKSPQKTSARPLSAHVRPHNSMGCCCGAAREWMTAMSCAAGMRHTHVRVGVVTCNCAQAQLQSHANVLAPTARTKHELGTDAVACRAYRILCAARCSLHAVLRTNALFCHPTNAAGCSAPQAARG